MTSPDFVSGDTRFALFASGASFSIAVLRELDAKGFQPELVVIPEYPPAENGAENIFRVAPMRHFLQFARRFEFAYAPQDAQEQCAALLRQRTIDYLLVACWPYLIGTELRRSVREAALNLHPSILPKYRGANPVAAQIDRVDTRCGVTLHLLDDQFDHGDIVAQSNFDLALEELNPETIETRCAALGVDLFAAAVNSRGQGWQLKSQPDQALDTD